MTLNENIDKVLKETSEGVVKIQETDTGDFWRFYVKFATNLEGRLNKTIKNASILNIPSYENFYNKVEKYISHAKEFYANDKQYFRFTDDGFEQNLFTDLILNATEYELGNILPYIDKRTKMICKRPIWEEAGDAHNQHLLHLGSYNNAECYMEITKNRSHLEAPFTANIIFRNEENGVFYLPKIIFGIADGTTYIYAIQNTSKQDNLTSFAKKFDRHFRKLNLNVDTNDIEAMVSPNALASLTIFFAYLKQNNLRKIESPSFLPVRYHASLVSKYVKSKHTDCDELLQIQDRDQFNMTNRLMYVMLRYCKHFNSSLCFFDENTQVINLSLNNQQTEIDENIIYELDKAISNQFEKILDK